MNPFDCFLSQRLESWRDSGLERSIRVADGVGAKLSWKGRDVISFASNDYLGLSNNQRVCQAAQDAILKFGAGATASRLICGSKSCHAELESDLANFKRTESALVFGSGYQAAISSMVALLQDCDNASIVIDRLAHASLIDGAKLTGARLRTFKHNDPEDLERVLREEVQRKDTDAPTLVVLESLYSMDGDVAPLAAIWALVERYQAWMLVDEAHATGVLGEGGRGVLSDIFKGPLPLNVLSMGTLSKALGSQGGFVCAASKMVKLIVHAGRAFVFSTALAPASAAAARASLQLISEDPGNRKRLLKLSEDARCALRSMGWNVLGGPGPILPILIGDERKVSAMAERLFQAGYWVPAIRYPTVKRGAARLRLSFSAAHTATDVDGLLSEMSLF